MNRTDRIPDLSATRTGTSVSIDVENIRDRRLLLYKASESKGLFTLLTELDSTQLPYIDTIAADAKPKYKAGFLEVESSVDVLSINTTTQPYYVEFEPIPPTTGAIVLNTFIVSWGPDLIDIPIIELSNLAQGSYSQSILTGKTT